MPQQWIYREPERHPPTQIVPWQPQRYSQTAHLRRLAPLLPEPARMPEPSFSPQPQARPQPRYGRAHQPHYAPRPQYQPWDHRPQQYQTPVPRRKPRVFLWVFLGIQALFLIGIIVGLTSHPAGPSAAAQAAQQCANGGWQGLFKSQADCQQHYAVALNDAGKVGKGIGAAFIVIAWMIADFFLGLGYGIYRLASRR
ncbi:MAG: hypothetical protein ACRDOI_35460 [Trebonia sp.]